MSYQNEAAWAEITDEAGNGADESADDRIARHTRGINHKYGKKRWSILL
jgi:hypothetical protein